MSNYIPTYQHYDRMPVDISFVFKNERPAGKHGFVTIPEGKDSFYFEDGTPARFWGVIMNGAANFPEHDYAEKIARRLMQAGVNYVRFHQLDSEWATPNYYRMTSGERVVSTRELCPESMERLDYWIKTLKEHGIYACVDMCTYRKFKSGDGVKFANDMDQNVKRYAHYDPVMIDLQKEFCDKFWNHFNPYTGLKYKDDPFFLACVISNENDTFKEHKGSRQYGTKIPYYEDMFEDFYAEWLKENGHADMLEEKNGRTVVKDYKAFDQNDLLQAEFREVLEKRYADDMYAYIRSLGVRVPICDTSWPAGNGLTFAEKDMDFKACNNYFYDWGWGEYEKKTWNKHIVDNPVSHLGGNCSSRLAGHAIFQTEWDMPWSNSYRAEGPIWYPSVAVFNGYSGMSIHTYCYSTYLHDDMILGKESPANGIGGVPYREGIFACWNDPAKFGLFYFGAMLFRRGDLSPAKKTIGARVTDPNLWKLSRKLADTAMEVHKVVTLPPDVSDEEAMTKYGLDEIRSAESEFTKEEKQAVVEELRAEGKHFLPASSKNVIMSDTGELWRDLSRQVAAVDTPRTKIVYGMLAKDVKAGNTNKPYEMKLNGVTVSCNTDFAVVGMSSLNDKPITHSDNILLCTVGRASNTDAWFDGEKMVNYGHLPIQMEVIDAEIEIETDVPDLRVWSITTDGFYGGRVPVEYLDGKIRFHVGPHWPSEYYLIMQE
ncbi:MAG: hypothetical protein IKY02_06415 [Lachnospiraceae bacterium]|nr:hypothetical protein [Lachnospiraceae bacterium]